MTIFLLVVQNLRSIRKLLLATEQSVLKNHFESGLTAVKSIFKIKAFKSIIKAKRIWKRINFV
jgi:hypothetical protein